MAFSRISLLILGACCLSVSAKLDLWNPPTVVDLLNQIQGAAFGIGSKLMALPSLSPSQLKQVGPDFTTVLDMTGNQIIYGTPTTAIAYNALGQIECTGFDNANGVNVFSYVWGSFINGDKSTDLGGDYACSASCDGTCEVYPTDRPVAPASTYPFGCKCSEKGCDANGPKMPTNWSVIGANVVCSRDTRCSCDGEAFESGYNGYLCNWINVANNQTIYLKLDSQYSPIRWCDCCPKSVTA